MKLMGCLLTASNIERGGKKYIGGPIFTVDKVNSHGWALDAVEAETMAESLVGKPVRNCNCGTALAGIAKEHSCDVAKDDKSVIASVDSVYKKVGKNGEVVWYAEAILHDGVGTSGLPDGWSIFGTASSVTDAGFAVGVSGDSIALTSNPAYSEAKPLIYASASPADLSISIKGANSVNQMDMVDTNSTPGQTTLTGEAVKTSVPAQSTTQATKVFTEEEINERARKIAEELIASKTPKKEDMVAEIRSQIRKEEMADGIIKRMVKDGSIKDTEAGAKLEELKAMDLKGIELIKSTLDSIPSQARVAPGVADVGVAATGNTRQLKPGELAWMERLGIPEAAWRKYNP